MATILEEEVQKYAARGNLIEDIIVYRERHSLDKVCLFLERNYDIKTVSSASALHEFLNNIDIPCDIIASRPEHLKEFYTNITKKRATGRFLGVTVGCKDLLSIDAYANYKDTFVLFNVFGPLKTKGFGVLNYTSSEVSCTAEIVFNQIFAYAEKNNIQITKNIAQHLYTALIAGTKRYGSNIKKDTFVVAKQLLDLGADYKLANYLCERKNPLVLQIQEMIFKTLVRADRICYAFIKETELPQGTTMNILQDTLSLFKKTDKIDVWVLFIDRGYGYYNVVLQGKEINPFDLDVVARKNNGTGDHTTGQCSIRHCDVNKVLDEIRLLFEKKGFWDCPPQSQEEQETQEGEPIEEAD